MGDPVGGGVCAGRETTSYNGFKIWDLKMLDPLGSTPGTSVAQRGAFVGMGNTAWEARELVLGREARDGRLHALLQLLPGPGGPRPVARACCLGRVTS